MLFSPKKGLPSFRLSPSPAFQSFNTAFSTEKPIKSSPARARATTPRSKLRHEDSQISFEAINSSPITDQESQLLTDRQREVAERQRLETAPMFSDISSPARRRATEISSDPLNSDAPDERPSTPILQPALDDDLPGSSPTVASVSRRQSSLSRKVSPKEVSYGPWRDDDDIPSSPPRVDDEEENANTVAEPSGAVLILRQATISPMRLQSQQPEDSSHDFLLEEARLAFSLGTEELPVASQDHSHFQTAPVYQGEEIQSSSSVDRDLVHAQIEAEVHQSIEKTPNKKSATELTSSVVADSGGNDTGLVNRTNVTSLADDSKAPETHFARRLKLESSAIFDTSRIMDSFPTPEVEPNVQPESQKNHQATQEDASQDNPQHGSQPRASLRSDGKFQVLEQRKRGRPRTRGTSQDQAEDASQRTASIDTATHLEGPTKRKRGLSRVPEPVERAKPSDGIFYFVGRGNPPARPATNTKLLLADNLDALESITFKPTDQLTEEDEVDLEEGEETLPGPARKKSKRNFQSSFQAVGTSEIPVQQSSVEMNDLDVSSPVTSKVHVLKVPALGRRSSSRLSQMSRDEQEHTESTFAVSGSSSNPVPSRLSGMSADSSALDESSGAAPISKQTFPNSTDSGALLVRKGRASLASQPSSLQRRASTRSSQTDTSNALSGPDDLPPRTRILKRTLSQSKDEASPTASAEAVGPAISAFKRRKIAPRTASTNLRLRQKPSSQVTTGNVESSQSSNESTAPEEVEEVSRDSAVEQPGEASTFNDERPPQLPRTATDAAASELSQSAQSSSNERRILTPKSIIAKLRGLLSDCKSMVFGSQEQRQIDDALFEIKSEVFKQKED
jgi:hypothetical protein